MQPRFYQLLPKLSQVIVVKNVFFCVSDKDGAILAVSSVLSNVDNQDFIAVSFSFYYEVLQESLIKLLPQLDLKSDPPLLGQSGFTVVLW